DDACLGKAHTALTFEVEWFGDNTDCEDAELAGDLRDDRSSAGAGAATHARSDKHHMRAGEMIADFVDHFFGGGAANLRLRTGAETLGHLRAHLDDALCFRHRERLRVRVGDNEVDALQAGRDHVVHGIAAGAAYAENSDPRLHFPDVRDRQIDGHVCLMIARAAGSALRPECERTCTPPNWTSPPPADSMSGWFRVRSFRAAIVRPVPCNRPFLLSIAAFAAVRSVRDKPLVGTQADLQPPQKPALLPHQANR